MNEENLSDNDGNIFLDTSKFNCLSRPSFWKFIIEDLPSFSCDNDSDEVASVQVDATLKSLGVSLSLQAKKLYPLSTKALILCKVMELIQENSN
jgi:hypothetical protein